MKMLKNEKGFTLIELVLIIVVLGILGAVATLQFGTVMTDSKDAAIDGAFGSFGAQLALAINENKALPVSGAGAGSFGEDVHAKVSIGGDGVVISAYTAASDTFGICAGSTDCTDAATPTCTGTHRSARVTYNPTTGALTLGTKGNC
ncbi:MAG: type II secretion system protein [Nitrospiria bacterium]